MSTLSFKSRLEQDADGTWWYVHVPKDIRDKFKEFEKRGIIHVTVSVGSSTWDGSMLPWADGSAQVSINKKVRAKEHIELGDLVQVSLTPR